MLEAYLGNDSTVPVGICMHAHILFSIMCRHSEVKQKRKWRASSGLLTQMNSPQDVYHRGPFLFASPQMNSPQDVYHRGARFMACVVKVRSSKKKWRASSGLLNQMNSPQDVYHRGARFMAITT